MPRIAPTPSASACRTALSGTVRCISKRETESLQKEPLEFALDEPLDATTVLIVQRDVTHLAVRWCRDCNADADLMAVARLDDDRRLLIRFDQLASGAMTPMASTAA